MKLAASAERRRQCRAAPCWRGPILLLAWLSAPGFVQGHEVPDIATSPSPATATAADSRAGLLDRRSAAQSQFLRLLDEKRLDEALVVAQQIVALTAEAFGEASMENVKPLQNLAAVQLDQGDAQRAAANYQACVTLIERNEGILSPRLISPLLELGTALNRSGLHEQARDVYLRALQVNHAGQGFYNPDQFPIRDGLTEAYAGLQKFDEATFQQEAQVRIQQHRFGAGSAEVVPSLTKLAGWYERSGQLPQAEAAYREARRILERSSSPADPRLVDVLLGEAQTYRDARLFSGSIDALKRALTALNAQPEPEVAKRADVLVTLGDTYTIFGKPTSGREQYAEAWRVLSQDPASEKTRDGYFARPTWIDGPPLSSFSREAQRREAKQQQTALADGFVVARMTIDEDGHAHDVAVMESNPAGVMDDAVTRMLRVTVFRPMIVDGAPVRTEHATYRHEFKYVRTEKGNGGSADSGDDRSGKRIDYPGSGQK